MKQDEVTFEKLDRKNGGFRSGSYIIKTNKGSNLTPKKKKRK